MEPTGDESHEKVIERLTAGFGALLEQVQELARRNQELESRLTRVREEVSGSRSCSPLLPAVMIHNSSRSEAIHLAVIENIPIY